MIRKIKYGDEPLGDVKIIPDFLPCRKELVFCAEKTKSKRGSKHGRKSQYENIPDQKEGMAHIGAARPMLSEKVTKFGVRMQREQSDRA